MRRMQDEERGAITTNGWAAAAAIGLAAALLLWTALFAAYRLDRPDATAVASLTVLLTVPPLVSYYLVMELSAPRMALAAQIALVFAAALLWLAVQRGAIYPLIGFDVSIGESVANLILLPVFGIAAWLAVRSFSYRRRLDRALALQAQTELRLLGAQLAPHTLFNMLNAVYSVLLADRDKAVPLFLAMSDALRHVVDRTREPWIALHDEIDFIENYAVLERARNPERVTIAIRGEGDLSVPVPPMLLATLFENAVTHGRFPDGALAIEVEVRVTDADMTFDVTNRYPDAPGRPGGTGVGLSNVRNRLRLLYPGRSAFSAEGAEGIWRAGIRIAP